MRNQVVIGNATGKIILMGEHSVVYREPAIAIPFRQVGVETALYKSKGPIYLRCLYHSGQLSDAPILLSGLTEIIRRIVESFGEKLADFSICIDSSIPPERGMGSSAAVSIATIRGLYDYFGRPLTHDALLKWANISEKIIHGKPSGIDASVISSERALYYTAGMPPKPFNLNLNAYLIIIDTGRASQTKTAIEEVRRRIELNSRKGKSLIRQLGAEAELAKNLIEYKDIKGLGQAMTRAHLSLDALNVSDDKLNFLVRVALDSGALGAKLTGGGMGGAMIVLVQDRAGAICISDKLIKSGAKNAWISRLGGDCIDK